jgi:uncharacterized protein (DUF2147 family)
MNTDGFTKQIKALSHYRKPARNCEYDIADAGFAGMQACFPGGSMACRLGFIVATLTALLAAAPAQARPADEVVGIWLTQAGDAKVRVSKCGGGICGVVVELKNPIDPATGKPQVDDKNPDRALAKRPVIGITLFSGMRPSGPNQWAGPIYNADDGNSYASKISVSGHDTLRVEGCVGALCGGETWTRSGR